MALVLTQETTVGWNGTLEHTSVPESGHWEHCSGGMSGRVCVCVCTGLRTSASKPPLHKTTR